MSIKNFYDYAGLSNLIKGLCYNSVKLSPESEDLAVILEENPRLLCVANHGPMFGPAPALAAFIELQLKNGGARRSPLIVIWKYFYKYPVTRKIASYLSQTSRILHADEFIERYQSKRFSDIIVFPEGENCNFGNGNDIQPFLSPKFVEIAININTPVLIYVHKGTEHWAKTRKINRRFEQLIKLFPERVHHMFDESSTINTPRIFTKKIDHITCCFQLHQLSLTLDEFNQHYAEEKQELLLQEADKIREKMVHMMHDMDKHK